MEILTNLTIIMLVTFIFHFFPFSPPSLKHKYPQLTKILVLGVYQKMSDLCSIKSRGSLLIYFDLSLP